MFGVVEAGKFRKRKRSEGVIVGKRERENSGGGDVGVGGIRRARRTNVQVEGCGVMQNWESEGLAETEAAGGGGGSAGDGGGDGVVHRKGSLRDEGGG